MDYAGKLLLAGEGALAIEPHERNSGIQSVQNLESIINEGLRVALLEETPDQSLLVLLEHLGKALNGERTYIFEQNESGGDDNTYEWVADGVAPEQKNLQNVPPEVCASWYRNFSVGGHIAIKNVEDIQESEPQSVPGASETELSGGEAEPEGHSGGGQNRHLDHRAGGGLPAPNVCGPDHADAPWRAG